MTSEAEDMGERLETVRADQGLSLRAFWRRLVGGDEDGPFEWSEEDEPNRPGVGYRTVTRYHRGERVAPVEYVRRVAEEFDVRIRWLVEGSGSMRRSPWQAGPFPGPLHYHLREERDFFERYAMHGLGVQLSFLDLLHLVEISWSSARKRNLGDGPGPLGRGSVERAEDLRFALRLPLIALGYGHVRDVPAGYWRTAMNALTSALDEFWDRDDVGLEEPFILEFRRAYEGDDFDSDDERSDR